jgi:aspartyl-tRNA(Asn)/glutamyl-tRNA(Gln) amidotransferase subunit B
VKSALPVLPDQLLEFLTADYGLTEKDARTLISLDDGERLEYYLETVDIVSKELGGDVVTANIGRQVGNW